MATPTLQVSGLRFRWPGQSQDLVHVDELTLAGGQSLLIQGESGCGKSTLLALAAGVLLPSAGQVCLLGQDWQALSPGRREQWRADHIGYLFQQFNLLGWLPAIDNVELGCAFSARRTQRALASSTSLSAAAAQWLDAMQLPRSRWSCPGAQLSIGEQQRVAAARALIGAPELVLADEPTSALDERLRDAFVESLLISCRQAGSALLLVSHDRALETRMPRVERLAELAGA